MERLGSAAFALQKSVVASFLVFTEMLEFSSPKTDVGMRYTDQRANPVCVSIGLKDSALQRCRALGR